MRDIHMWNLLGAHVPNVLPDVTWIRKAGRLIWASVMLAGGIGIVVAVLRRPKRSNEPATWAQSIAGAFLTLGLMTLAYGTVPHEWLNFSNSYLNWSRSFFVVHHDQLASHIPPFDISKAALAESIVAVMYLVFLSLNVHLFVAWQKRKVAEPASAEEQAARPAPAAGPFARFRRREKRVSAYGRPVTTPE